jgi:hypothetical protein
MCRQPVIAWVSATRRITTGAAAGWVGGFITTYNSYVQNGKRDILEGMTANDALRWVASWCRDNSSRDLEYALEALIESRD